MDRVELAGMIQAVFRNGNAQALQGGSRISRNAGIVKAVRQSIPAGGHGAFITTADFQSTASETAQELRFPRIGLANGRQLVGGYSPGI